LFVLLISRQLKYLLLIHDQHLSNLIAACIFYYFLHIEIHLYTLAGDRSPRDDHRQQHHHDRPHPSPGEQEAFLAILAATLTTIGAIELNLLSEGTATGDLVEFAQVIIINLSVSMCVALFFIRP
jgi:hypothetical protein